MSELKPCPFCGGEVEIMKARVLNEADWIRHIGKPGCTMSFDNFPDEGDVADLWNTRTPPPGYALIKIEDAGRVERVAKAIYETDPATEMKAIDDWGKEHVLEPISWENAPEIPHEKLEAVFDYAEAAIAAVMEGNDD